MSNFFKFIFFKLYKSKMPYIVTIVALLLIVFYLYAMYLIADATLISESAVVAIDLDFSNYTMVDWCYMASASDLFLPFIAIFTVMIFGIDFSSGFIKNFYGKIHNKILYPVSYIIVGFIYSLFLLILSYIVAFIFGYFIAQTTTFGSIGELFEYSVLKLLLFLGYNSLLVLITFILKKLNISLIITLVYSLMYQVLYLIIDYIVEAKSGISDYSTSKYTLLGNIDILDLDIDTQQVIIIIVVSILSICISILGSFFIKDRDV